MSPGCADQSLAWLAARIEDSCLATTTPFSTMSTKTTTTPTVTTAGAEKVLVAKWGKAAIRAGFTALPDVIFRQPKALGLKRLDVLVVLHLASYWWKPNEFPRPAKASIADALDCDARTVQRSIEKMEKLGYVKRIERMARVGDNLPNQYDLRGLVKAIEKLATEESAKREKRAAEDKVRTTSPKTFGLIKGGKE
jgi:hypothetical protein